MQGFGVVVFILFIGFASSYVTVTNPLNAPDLPGFTPDIQVIPSGSLIIPMDPASQVLDTHTALLSVLPYGLVVRTLHANISVWWAIQTGKAQDGADFVAATQTTSFSNIVANPSTPPSPAPGSSVWTTGASTTTYSGGPFIILQKDAQNAFNQWNAWAKNPSQYYLTVSSSVYSTVKIHVLTADTSMDIRHKIYSRPIIAVSNLDGNAPTQTSMLGCVYQNTSGRQCPLQNGYGWGDIFGSGSPGCAAFQPQDHAGLDWNYHYQTYDCSAQVAALTTTTCLTTFSEPHWQWVQSTGPSYIIAMKNFVTSGANFFAQCASLQSYENEASAVGTGTFVTQYGVESINPSNGINQNGVTITNYPDLPVCQFVGTMSSAVTGQVPDFYNYFSATGGNTPPTGWSYTAEPAGTPTAVGYNNFQATAFPTVTNVYNVDRGEYHGRDNYVAAAAKYANLQLGANVWYLGGHTWSALSEAGAENGRRYFMNAMIIPANRPAACGFTFCTATDVCPPQDACHLCACNAAGSGFVQSLIANCCLSNPDCPGTCQECSLATHQCVLTPGCCSLPTIPCTGGCLTCTSGQCTTLSGCCFNNSQCGNSPCDICNNPGLVTAGCVTLPEPACCNPGSNTSCTTSPCMTCSPTNLNCTRITPISTCCLANGDCTTGAPNPCKACDVTTHACYDVPGCCNVNTDCGSDPCIECTNNNCVRKAACCESVTQCSACMVCTSNVCVQSPDPSCCITNSDCGTCKRCAVTNNNTKTCVELSNCCLSPSDCEACQNCSNSQCIPIAECCTVDADCANCEVCTNFNCTQNFALDCCEVDSDCQDAISQLQASGSTNYSSCPYSCIFNQTLSNVTGQCQAFCSSGKNWNGLIIGLAAGVPLLLLCLAGLIAGVCALLYFKKDAIQGLGLFKGNMTETGLNTSPAYQGNTTVGSSPVFQ